MSLARIKRKCIDSDSASCPPVSYHRPNCVHTALLAPLMLEAAPGCALAPVQGKLTAPRRLLHGGTCHLSKPIVVSALPPAALSRSLPAQGSSALSQNSPQPKLVISLHLSASSQLKRP